MCKVLVCFPVESLENQGLTPSPYLSTNKIKIKMVDLKTVGFYLISFIQNSIYNFLSEW